MALVLGQRIKEEREKRNLTQDQLAQTLNVSRQAISKWELGTAYPDIERLITLSDFFDISLDNLIKGDPDLKDSITIDNSNTPQTNFWDFLIHGGWIIVAIVWIIGAAIKSIWG